MKWCSEKAEAFGQKEVLYYSYIHVLIQLARFIHLPFQGVFFQHHQAILQFSADTNWVAYNLI